MVQLLSNLISPVPGNDPSDKRVDEVMDKILSGRREDDVIMWVKPRDFSVWWLIQPQPPA